MRSVYAARGIVTRSVNIRIPPPTPRLVVIANDWWDLHAIQIGPLIWNGYTYSPRRQTLKSEIRPRFEGVGRIVLTFAKHVPKRSPFFDVSIELNKSLVCSSKIGRTRWVEVLATRHRHWELMPVFPFKLFATVAVWPSRINELICTANKFIFACIS